MQGGCKLEEACRQLLRKFGAAVVQDGAGGVRQWCGSGAGTVQEGRGRGAGAVHPPCGRVAQNRSGAAPAQARCRRGAGAVRFHTGGAQLPCGSSASSVHGRC